MLIYWPEGVFLSEKEGRTYIDLVEGAGGAYIVLGDAAAKLWGKLKKRYKLSERGEGKF